jgi:hypothetical protein
MSVRDSVLLGRPDEDINQGQINIVKDKRNVECMTSAENPAEYR